MIGINEANLPGLKDPTLRKEGHQKVELFISCRRLKNKDIRSLSDPQVRIYSIVNGKEEFIDETEVIKDNLNPNFVKTFTLDYMFEIKQLLLFRVLDIDGGGKFNLLGEVCTSFGEIMGSRNQVLITDLIDQNQKAGKIILRTEIIDGVQCVANIQFSGKKLKNYAGLLSKSSPYFQLSRCHEETTNIVVYQSGVVPKKLNPDWEPFDISLKTLCNNDILRPIIASVYHKKKHMGQCSFSMHDVVHKDIKQFTLKKPKSATKTYGTFEVSKISTVDNPSFLEYIRRGVQLNVVTAIDFTLSNGSPKLPSSLHAIHKNGELNDYQNAIYAVSDILLCYDHDKKVPVYGFGGRVGGSDQASHCFPLTGSEEDDYAYGLDGIMELYKSALQRVSLSSPTYFKSVLRKGIDIAKKCKDEGSKVYTILLILTDGVIHDMQQSIDCLAECADLPISVIIIGVGKEDFKQMEILDGDNLTLRTSSGEPLQRDVVQFVAFDKFRGNKEALAEEVLAEVPKQLIDYMKAQGISLNPLEKVNVNSIDCSSPLNRPMNHVGI